MAPNSTHHSTNTHSSYSNLEWSHAWPFADKKDVLNSLSMRQDEIRERLTKELASGALPFISLPFAEKLSHEIEELTPYLRRFTNMVLLGIGGSALGARALQKAFFPQQDQPKHGGPWLWILDNVATENMMATFSKLDPHETLVVTISKSGGTIETISQYFFAKAWLQNALPQWQEHMLHITDAKKGFLREEVNRYGLRSLEVPEHVGGRYSVLTAVGLVPAAFFGMDWKGLLRGALDMSEALIDRLESPTSRDAKPCLTTPPTGPIDIEHHPAWNLALWNASLMENGYNDLIFFIYIPKWATLSAWFAQLWAESLGKNGKGSMPIPAIGVTDQHSLQQMFLDGPKNKACLFLTSKIMPQGPQFPNTLPPQWQFLQDKSFDALLDAESLGTSIALKHANVPLVSLEIADLSPYSAGRLIMLLELTTVLTGWLLDCNPLDQPAVEFGKRISNARLGAYQNTEMCQSEKALLHTYLAQEKSEQKF